MRVADERNDSEGVDREERMALVVAVEVERGVMRLCVGLGGQEAGGVSWDGGMMRAEPGGQMTVVS